MAKTLFDFCTLTEGTRSAGTISITAQARFGNTADPEHRMEKRLLLDSEYTLLRGGSGFDGILRQANIMPVRSINEQSVRDLLNGVSEKTRKDAVFMMNAVTLQEIHRSLRYGSDNILTCDAEGNFRLMGASVVLSNAMPCAGEGTVPVLYGDFSQICIEDCGRDELLTASGEKSDLCVMTGYINCRIKDKSAIWGIKII